MKELRQRLIDLGMTGYVEQQQVIDEVKCWLVETRKHWKGNNLCVKREYPTIDWAIDELIEELTYPPTNSKNTTQGENHE